MDWPSVPHIIYCMVSAQQANLSECEAANFRSNAIFARSLSHPRLYMVDIDI